MGGVRAVVEHVLTGQERMMHELSDYPRREVALWLHEQHPWLARVVVSEWARDEETVMRWLASAVAEHGEYHEVEPMPSAAYGGR
jgi:hypothetical protein